MAIEVYNPEPTSLVAVTDQCRAIEAWAAQCDSIPELRDGLNKLAAINEYLARTATEGRREVEATSRRLEARIGELLPTTTQGKRTDLATSDRDPKLVDHRIGRDFRLMAAHPEIIEQVVAESTDKAPASRRKVIAAIRGAEPERSQRKEPDTTDTTTRGSIRSDYMTPEEFVAKVVPLAESSMTSRQIAAALERSEDYVRRRARELGVVIPADAVAGRRFNVDQNKVFDDLVVEIATLAFGVGLVEFDELDTERVAGWVDSLTPAIRSLNQMLKRVKELPQ